MINNSKLERENKIISISDFEAKQNLSNVFSILLEVVLRNPGLQKKIFNENDENNGNTNNTN